MNKIEVIIVAGMDPNVHKTGGIASYLSNLINHLQSSNDNIQITFIGISYSDEDDYPFTFIPVGKNIKSGYRYVLNLFLKVPFLKIPTTSIIHANGIDEMFPFILFHRKNPKVCRLAGKTIETVYLLHGKFIGKIYEMVGNFTLQRSDCCIAVDESTAEYFIGKYPWLKNKVKIIYAGIDLKKFRPLDKSKLREKYKFDKNNEIIIYVGRLEIEKNVGFLIRAFVNVKMLIKNSELILVGDGRDRINIERFVDQNGIKDVTFMGTVNHNKIPEIIDCADVCALCSLYEGSPAIVKEALACGIPVISTDVGDVKKWITSDTIGKIVDGDEKMFAGAIIEIIKKDQEIMREKCKNISQQFSFDLTMKKTVEVYKEVLELKKIKK